MNETSTSSTSGESVVTPVANSQKPSLTPPPRKAKSQPTKTLPSDRLTFDKQISALRAFGVAYGANGGKPVTNDDAGKIIGMAAGTIVVTNAFFCDVGFLQRQKECEGFIPSQDVMAYLKAYEWDQEKAKEKLRPALESMWFSQVLVPRLKSRPYDLNEAVAALAEACSASKEYEPRLIPIIEYLTFVGILVKDGNQIKTATPQSLPALPDPAVDKPSVGAVGIVPPAEDGLEQYTLVLDAKTRRKIIIHAPATIKKSELTRIQSWLSVQLIVEDEAKTPE